MHPIPLSKKLRIPAGEPILIMNSPESYLNLLGDLPAGVRVDSQPAGMYTCTQVFVNSRIAQEDLRRIVVESIKMDGLLWITYPKRSSNVETDLSRKVVWELMKPVGFRPVIQTSVDRVWSALRFRPVGHVGT